MKKNEQLFNFTIGEKLEWDSFEDFQRWEKTGEPKPKVIPAGQEPEVEHPDFEVTEVDTQSRTITLRGLNEKK